MRWLLLGLILIPALEIGVFVWAGGYLGPWGVISLILITGVLGVVLAKQQGLETWNKAQESMSHGNVPTEQIIDGLCILVGSILLVLPGFITDIVGLILLLHFTRYPLKVQMMNLFKRLIQRGPVTFRRW